MAWNFHLLLNIKEKVRQSSVYISSEEINNRSTILCHLVVMADEEALLPNLYPYSDDSDVDEDFDYSRRS